MGLYYSREKTFIEPLAYGFEDDIASVDTSKFTLLKTPAGNSSAILSEGCKWCIRRTKNAIRIEDSALTRWNLGKEDLQWSIKRRDLALEEYKASCENLSICSQKYATHVTNNDRPPPHIRHELSNSYTRKRAAREKNEHAAARMNRKDRAIVNLETLYQGAKERTRKAINRQIDCSRKSSRRKVWAH